MCNSGYFLLLKTMCYLYGRCTDLPNKQMLFLNTTQSTIKVLHMASNVPHHWSCLSLVDGHVPYHF